MNGRPKASFEFGEYRLIPAERLLLRGGSPMQVPSKAFDILVVLVENAGELVDNKTMLELVWPDSFVEESNIQVQISLLRKTLNANGGLIETVPKVGYRFTGIVTVDEMPMNGNGSETSNPPVIAKILTRSRARFLIIGILIVAFIGVALLFALGRLNRSVGFTGDWRMTKLTDSGSSFGGVISPDGKYAAYQSIVNGKYSLWLMDIDAKTAIPIGPERDKQLQSISFTPADEAIYYGASEGEGRTAIFRVSRLGGEPRKVISDADGPFTFSPDGRKFAFVRKNPEPASMSLITASLDGNEQQVLATRTGSASFAISKRPSWSPNGSKIAVIGTNEGEKFQRVLSVAAANGQTDTITVDDWKVLQDVAWEGNSDHIIITAQDDIHFGPNQIWRTSVSGAGRAEKVTRELDSYVGLSMASDAKSLISTVSVTFNNLWLVPLDGTSPGQQILSNKGGGRVDTSWMPDDHIVYTSNVTGFPNIFMMRSDGTDPVQLTSDSFWKRSPVVSPDGKQILYVSSLNEPERIWLMRSDGSDQHQLNFEQVYRYPQFSPDGKSIIFTTWKGEASYMWRISTGGGEHLLLRGPDKFTPNLSPDMSMIAYCDMNRQTGGGTIKVITMSDDKELSSIEVKENLNPESVRWSPDSKDILYRGSDGNIWFQRIGSGEPRKMTNLTSDFPLYCGWTPDMKRLLCIREVRVRNVVMFSGRE